MKWILKLAAAGGEGPWVDVLEISKPDDLGDIANLGLTLAEAKQLLARVQREISIAQATEHSGRRPVCPCCDGVCQVKDYRDHAVATLFGQVMIRLPRFRCGACGRNAAPWRAIKRFKPMLTHAITPAAGHSQSGPVSFKQRRECHSERNAESDRHFGEQCTLR